MVEKKNRPVDDLRDLDLDLALTAEEREAFHDTPFFDLPKVVGGIFVLAVLVLVLGNAHQARQRQYDRAERTLQGLAQMERRSQTASPGRLVTLMDSWQDARRTMDAVEVNEDLDRRLERASITTAAALLERGRLHLSALQYLEMVEAAQIAAAAKRMLDVLPAEFATERVSRQALEQRLASVASLLTQQAVTRAANAAEPAPLRESAVVLFRLASVVDAEQRAEFERTARDLLARAQRLQEQGGVGAHLGEAATSSARTRFAAAAMDALQGAGVDVRSVDAVGPGSQTLRVVSGMPAREALSLVLGAGEMASRLAGMGFLSVESVGADGGVRLDLETMQVRPLPGS